MAIAGYTPYSPGTTSYGPGGYSSNVLPLLKDYVGSDSKIGQFISMCKTYKQPMFLMNNGALDIDMLLSSSGDPPDWDNVQFVMDPDDPLTGVINNSTISVPLYDKMMAESSWNSLVPFHDTFIDGVYTIFIGLAAVKFYQQELMGQQSTAGISPPVLGLVSVSAPIDSESVVALETVNFVATFMTTYGETAPSGVVSILHQSGWRVVLDIETDSIPSSVTSVIYYRSFGDLYFKVAEVFRPVGE